MQHNEALRSSVCLAFINTWCFWNFCFERICHLLQQCNFIDYFNITPSKLVLWLFRVILVFSSYDHRLVLSKHYFSIQFKLQHFWTLSNSLTIRRVKRCGAKRWPCGTPKIASNMLLGRSSARMVRKGSSFFESMWIFVCWICDFLFF